MAQNLPPASLCLSGGQVGEWGIIFLCDGWVAVAASHPHTVFQFHIENGTHVVAASEEGADGGGGWGESAVSFARLGKREVGMKHPPSLFLLLLSFPFRRSEGLSFLPS